MYVQGVPIVTSMLAIRKCQHRTFTVTNIVCMRLFFQL